MLTGKWDIDFIKRPLNTIVQLSHDRDVKGSFLIEEGDEDSLSLWTELKASLKEKQSDKEPNTRLN